MRVFQFLMRRQKTAEIPRAAATRGNDNEAVVQALRVFREHDWCDQDLRGSAASVVVKITAHEVEHRVRIRDFASWLEAAAKSPAEIVLKNRLREIISGQ